MHNESTTTHGNMNQTTEIIANDMAHHIDAHVDRDEIAKMYLEFSTGEQQSRNWKTTPKQQELMMALNQYSRSIHDITDDDMDTIHVRVGEILSSHPFKNRAGAMSPLSYADMPPLYLASESSSSTSDDEFDLLPPCGLTRKTAQSLSSTSDDEFDKSFKIQRGYSLPEHELLHMERLEGKTREDVEARILEMGSYLEGEYFSNGNEVSISNGCFEIPVACRNDFLLRVDTNLDGDNRYSVIDVYAREEEKRCAEMKYIDSLLNPDMSAPTNAYTFTSEGKRILCETHNYFAIVPGNRDSTPQALSETSGPCSLVHVLVFTKRRIWNAVSTEQMLNFDFDEAKDCANEAIRIVLENDPTKRIPVACAYDRLAEANENDMFSTTAAKCYTYEDLAWRARTVEYSFHLYPHNSINTLHMHAWCPHLKTKSYDHQTKDKFKYVPVASVMKAHASLMTWKQKAGILTDEERVTITDLAKPPVPLRFSKTVFFNGEKLTVEEFQDKVMMPSLEELKLCQNEEGCPPKSSPIACAKKDLSIPHFSDETRMKLQWFDDAKAHVEKYFDSDEKNIYKETYAPIPNFISDTPQVDITWFEEAKQFVKNNWVLVGEDTYAKPGSIYTKQGRFQNSLEWKDPLKRSKRGVRESVISVANDLKTMSPTDRQSAVDAINKRFMAAGVTEPMGGTPIAAAWEGLGDNVDKEPRWEDKKKAASGPRLTRARSECCNDTGLPRLTRAMSENVL